MNFVIITKTLCIQLEKGRQTPQNSYKNNCFREFFCNSFGQEASILVVFDPLVPAGNSLELEKLAMLE